MIVIIIDIDIDIIAVDDWHAVKYVALLFTVIWNSIERIHLLIIIFIIHEGRLL